MSIMQIHSLFNAIFRSLMELSGSFDWFHWETIDLTSTRVQKQLYDVWLIFYRAETTGLCLLTAERNNGANFRSTTNASVNTRHTLDRNYLFTIFSLMFSIMFPRGGVSIVAQSVGYGFSFYYWIILWKFATTEFDEKNIQFRKTVTEKTLLHKNERLFHIISVILGVAV